MRAIFFDNENDALDRCEIRNKACRLAGNYKEVYAVVDGPDNNYAVVSLKDAIELGIGYKILY